MFYFTPSGRRKICCWCFGFVLAADWFFLLISVDCVTDWHVSVWFPVYFRMWAKVVNFADRKQSWQDVK